MRDLELVLKAAGDPTRTRILKLLERGGLCVCQVQAVLGLAPSTVSKHLAILKNAGLVEDHRDGKWIEYALTDGDRNPFAKPILAMLQGALDRDPAVVADRRRLHEVKKISLAELCSITPSRAYASSAPPGPRRTRSERQHA